jgi:hypothetical protein
MSTIPSEDLDDDLLPEYDFDYSKAKPNRFAASVNQPLLKVVVLDEDVAQVFTTPESVNKVLRGLIESMPHSTDSKVQL